MIDEELRVYERALLRSGQDPRAVAAKILGADPERYWLLVEADSVPESMWEPIKERATLVHDVTLRQNMFAIRVVTIGELEDNAKPLRALGVRFVVWDRRAGRHARIESQSDMAANAVQEGWLSGANLLDPVPSAGGGDVTIVPPTPPPDTTAMRLYRVRADGQRELVAEQSPPFVPFVQSGLAALRGDPPA